MLTRVNTAQTAGLILAVAGTTAATGALERHPGVWATCIREAGYLSASLENLLVSWIQKGDEGQTIHALNLLSGRLSADRFKELINLLPSLSMSKADLVASMLLKEMSERPPSGRGDWVPLTEDISMCVAKLKDPSGWAKSNIQLSHYHRFYGPTEVVLAGVAIKRTKPTSDSKSVNRMLQGGGTWAEGGGELILWLAAAGAVAIPVHGTLSGFCLIAICIGMVCFAIGGHTWTILRPLFPTFLLRRSRISIFVICALMSVGAASVIAIQGPLNLGDGVHLRGALALSTSCGWLAVFKNLSLSDPRTMFCSASKYFRAARITMLSWLAIATPAAIFYAKMPLWTHKPMRGGASILFVLALAFIIYLFADYRRVASASNELALELVDAES
jgi:hypothetical protein